MSYDDEDESRALNEDALKDKTFEKPEKVAGDWVFLQKRVQSAKSDVEDELEEEFSTFKAVKFIKREFNYVIRVQVDSGYVDVYMRGKILNSVQGGKSEGSPMRF